MAKRADPLDSADAVMIGNWPIGKDGPQAARTLTICGFDLKIVITYSLFGAP